PIGTIAPVEDPRHWTSTGRRQRHRALANTFKQLSRSKTRKTHERCAQGLTCPSKNSIQEEPTIERSHAQTSTAYRPLHCLADAARGRRLVVLAGASTYTVPSVAGSEYRGLAAYHRLLADCRTEARCGAVHACARATT